MKTGCFVPRFFSSLSAVIWYVSGFWKRKSTNTFFQVVCFQVALMFLARVVKSARSTPECMARLTRSPKIALPTGPSFGNAWLLTVASRLGRCKVVDVAAWSCGSAPLQTGNRSLPHWPSPHPIAAKNNPKHLTQNISGYNTACSYDWRALFSLPNSSRQMAGDILRDEIASIKETVQLKESLSKAVCGVNSQSMASYRSFSVTLPRLNSAPKLMAEVRGTKRQGIAYFDRGPSRRSTIVAVTRSWFRLRREGISGSSSQRRNEPALSLRAYATTCG